MSSMIVSNVSSSATLTFDYAGYIADASGGSIVLTLPAIPGDGANLIIKRSDAIGGNTVTVVPDNVNETIDGATSVTLGVRQFITIVAINGVWNIISSNQPDNQANAIFSANFFDTDDAISISGGPTNIVQFNYPGTSVKSPNLFVATINALTASANYEINLEDVTNANTLAQLTGSVSVTGDPVVVGTTTFLNLPTTSALLRVTVERTAGSGTIQVHSVTLS